MKYKKLIYILIGCALIFWIGFRINSIYQESKRTVFNAARAAAVPVMTMEIHKKSDVLREPLFVKNNRAFVSDARRVKFKSGQSIGNGRIIFVSNNLDLDTGMYLIKTSGVKDGEHFAQQKYNGFFIPITAIRNNKVMIAQDGIATEQTVQIKNQDAQNALIDSGLNDGDILILSHVDNGTKVQIND